MLDNLRRMGRTWMGKVLGAFLVVGLAGFGISNVLLDFGSSNVATVGSEDITIREFQRAYNTDVNAFAQQIGRVPTPEEALSFGIPSGTLNQLAAEAAINQLGENMGLGVSEDRLSQMLRQDPTFAGTLGAFEPENFRRALQQLGYTEAEYFELQSRAARRQQVAAALFADTPVPDVSKELLARYTGDTRNIDYFIVNAQSAPSVEEPTEAELAAYLEENQARFRTEEQRTADVVVLTLDTLAEVQEISDADIEAEYERTRDSRVRIERRSIVQAPLNSDQEAAFQAGLAEGRSFDELVAETGVEIVDLGNLAKSQVTDPALAEAAFRLSADGFTIIPGIGGQRVVAVTSIEPGGEITLAEARDEIEQSLRRDAARDIYLDVLDQVEELRAAFQPLTEIGARYNLPVEEVTMTASGAALESVESIAADARQRVASTVFAAEEDRLTPPIVLGANTNIFVELKSVEPARDQTLEEVRGELLSTILDERTNAAIAELVDSILTRLENGEDFAEVALSMNLFPSLSPAITRSGDEVGIIDRTVAAAAFSGGEGHFGSAVNALGEHVVFQVSEVIPAPEDATPAVTEYLQQTQEQALYSSFVSGLRDQAGVRINRQVLDQVLGLDQTVQ